MLFLIDSIEVVQRLNTLLNFSEKKNVELCFSLENGGQCYEFFSCKHKPHQQIEWMCHRFLPLL